jgi:4-amino-4-deoxy-L-arabinose transferase-like glycosyltransferase
MLELTGRTGTNEIWVHRIPSYLAGAFAALALIWAGTPLVGRRAAVLGGVMLATVYMLERGGTDGEDRRDLAADHHPRHGGHGAGLAGSGGDGAVPAVFWTAMAAGLLVKGPVILMPVLTGAASGSR